MVVSVAVSLSSRHRIPAIRSTPDRLPHRNPQPSTLVTLAILTESYAREYSMPKLNASSTFENVRMSMAINEKDCLVATMDRRLSHMHI